MKNKKGQSIAIFLFIALIIGAFVGYSIGINNQEEIQSQCYTNLQPSLYFQGSPSPIYIINEGKKLVVESNDKMSLRQVIDTGSMRPAIPDYATLIVVKGNEFSIGDIILFDCHGKNIVHRIIDIQDGKYITKGDNNRKKDNCDVEINDINGKVVGVLY